MNPPRSAAPLPSPTRWLARLPDGAWYAFLIWTAIGAVVMPLGIGESHVRRWLAEGPTRQAAFAFLHAADAIWIILAATVIYLYTAAAEGLAVARRWSLIILGASACLEWIGTLSGWPFGPYRYTENFGWRLGGVLPVAIPLAWLVILLAGRYTVLRLWPAASRLQLALGVALIAVCTDLNLEFVAWKVRGYWVWYPDAYPPVPTWPPAQNFVAWFVVSLGLTYLLPPNYALRLHHPPSIRPVSVLILMNALFLLLHLIRFAGHAATAQATPLYKPVALATILGGWAP